MSRVNARMRRYRGGWNALEWGDAVTLVDGSAETNPTIYDVAWDGGVPLLTSAEDDTGVISIWAVTTPPAPYVLDGAAAAGVIAPLGTKRCQPASLQLGVNELVQARVKMRLIDTSPASGAVIDDFSLHAYLPGSSAVWGISNTKGVLSARQQVGDGADAVAAPLQGADQAGPAFAALNGWETAHQTELWWYGVNAQPTFEIVYFGAANTPAGIAIGLEVSLYRYLLVPHPAGAGARRVQRGGVSLSVPGDLEPDDIIGIPVAGRAAG